MSVLPQFILITYDTLQTFIAAHMTSLIMLTKTYAEVTAAESLIATRLESAHYRRTLAWYSPQLLQPCLAGHFTPHPSFDD